MVHIQFFEEEFSPSASASKLKKRKEIEVASEDFTLYSNLIPKKSRRLSKDLDFATVFEEDESIPVPISIQNLPNTSINQMPTISEAETSFRQNEVRTLALYQPNLTPNFHKVTLTVDSKFLDKYKLHPDVSPSLDNQPSSSHAIVPYVPSSNSAAFAMEEVKESDISWDEQGDAMDVEEEYYDDDQATMEFENEQQQQPFTEYVPMAMETTQGVFQLEQQQYKQQQFTNPAMYQSRVGWC